jgi:hypothetical protein
MNQICYEKNTLFTSKNDKISVKFDILSIIYKKLPSLHCNFRILKYLCTVFQPEDKNSRRIPHHVISTKWNY